MSSISTRTVVRPAPAALRAARAMMCSMMMMCMMMRMMRRQPSL
ncbi:hypothetical protein [Brachybacterium sp. SGAir0954]|nr:hypothetical protein [Brachybacterium sp. SGAir0954]